MTRDRKAQLTTARMLLAQFIMQLEEHDRYQAMNRRQKRLAIKNRTFDTTILDRIDGLREGKAKWEATVKELEETPNE